MTGTIFAAVTGTNITIYVPIRGVSETFNKIVDWDADFKQVKISDMEEG